MENDDNQGSARNSGINRREFIQTTGAAAAASSGITSMPGASSPLFAAGGSSLSPDYAAVLTRMIIANFIEKYDDNILSSWLSSRGLDSSEYTLNDLNIRWGEFANEIYESHELVRTIFSVEARREQTMQLIEQCVGAVKVDSAAGDEEEFTTEQLIEYAKKYGFDLTSRATWKQLQSPDSVLAGFRRKFIDHCAQQGKYTKAELEESISRHTADSLKNKFGINEYEICEHPAAVVQVKNSKITYASFPYLHIK